MKTYRGWRLFAATAQADVPGTIESERHHASGVLRVEVVDELGKTRPLNMRLRVRDHSREFNWGYGGSGPAQLALAICCDVFGIQRGCCPSLYQEFKRRIVATWGDTWEITAGQVFEWDQRRNELFTTKGGA